MAVGDDQLSICAGHAKHRKGAAFALAEGLEHRQTLGRDRHHVAFLRLVRPYLARAHARLFDMDFAQFDVRTQPGMIRELGHRVRQAPGADVVNRNDRVLVPLLPAGVDHLLAAALDFRIATLHGGEVEVSGIGAGRHRRGRPSTQANQHARATELDQQRPRRESRLVRLLPLDAAEAASDHDGLVIAAHLTLDFLLEGAEIAREVGATKFVVECRCANRPFDHDLKRGGDAIGLAEGFLPGLAKIGDVQVGNSEARQTRFRTRAPPGRTLIPNLATSAGGRTRERRNRGRVIMSFDLGEDVGCLFVVAEGAITIRVETRDTGTLDDGGIVRIRHHRALRVSPVGVLDHVEQRLLHRSRIDHPVGIEDLVPAVLGVGLRKHHQFDIGRIALNAAEVLEQIIDLVFGQGQAQFSVGLFQGFVTTREDVHRAECLRRVMMEERLCFEHAVEHRFGHAVMKQRQQRGVALGAAPIDRIRDAALNADDLVETTLMGNVGGLGRPRRNRSETGHDHMQATHRGSGRCRMCVNQIDQPTLLFIGQWGRNFDEIPILGNDRLQLGHYLASSTQKTFPTGGGQRRSAAQLEDRGHVIQAPNRSADRCPSQAIQPAPC